TVVPRFELAAVNRDAGFRQQPHTAAERNKPGADLSDRAAIILAEVSNRLVIGSESAREPHHLNLAPGLTLQPAARLHPVEIAVDVELQKDRRMIRRPASHLRINAAETQHRKIKFVDEDIDDTNRIVIINPVLQAFRKQRDLTAIRPFNEALHLILPQTVRLRVAGALELLKTTTIAHKIAD